MSVIRTHAERWFPPLLWAGVIFLLSSRPVLPGPSIPYADKVFHALEFGILALLLGRALFPLVPRRPACLPSAAVITVCLLYAVLDEAHQAFVPGRSCEVTDVLADVAGALLALSLGRRALPPYLPPRTSASHR